MHDIREFFDEILERHLKETDALLRQMEESVQGLMVENQTVSRQYLADFAQFLPEKRDEDENLPENGSQVELIKELVGGNDIRQINEKLQQLHIQAQTYYRTQQTQLETTLQNLTQKIHETQNRIQQKINQTCQHLTENLENQHEKHIKRAETQTIFNTTATKVKN